MAAIRHSIQKIGIIGAGVMGRGIAEACMCAGFTVILGDVATPVAEAAVQQLKARVSNSALVKPASCDADFSEIDLLIEAAPEDIQVKSTILSGIESHLHDGAIIASNTSSLSLTELGRSLSNATRFCGLHFCHPVRERRLVEVVAAKDTGDEIIARVSQFATKIGKRPLTVRDTPGFVLNRLLVPYLNESLELLLHGAPVELLDRAAASFGMRWRPLELFDEFGIDVAISVGRSLYRAWPDRIVPSELLIAMYKSGRHGRKSGGGFYHTAATAQRGELDPEVIRLIQHRRRSNETVSNQSAQLRLFLPMLLEATRIVEESLVPDVASIDAVLRGGLGLTRSDAGIFSWANMIGYHNLAVWLEDFRPLGKRFEPTQTFQRAAATRGRIGKLDPFAT
ncbi:MAG: hypothetical protein KDA90_17915 [Planctomycetaceae bacterium]|nr:hypothetical protein [Planctomycetaceae bacterium]